jgi:hypothetical protein
MLTKQVNNNSLASISYGVNSKRSPLNSRLILVEYKRDDVVTESTRRR